MASGRRNNNKMTRRKKLQPAVMQMELTVPTGTSYVDLALCSSLLNRRAYKQENTNWAVGGFEFLAATATTGTVVIAKLPETWVAENAYTKSRALWKEMQDQVLDNEPDIKGKYHDFKVFLDDAMRAEWASSGIQTSTNAGGKILTPFVGDWTTADFTAAAAPRADWNWSEIQIPNDTAPGTTDDYYLHMLGADSTESKGMIHGYAKSRARPQEQDPNVPNGSGWMTELFDLGNNDEEIREDLEEQNDRPPYALLGAATIREAYPGGSEEFTTPQVHGFCNFTNTTVSAKNSIQGGMFGLGLLKIVNNTDASLSLLVHMVPGDHRGYMVEEMSQ